MSSGGFPGAGDFYSSLASRLAAANATGAAASTAAGFGKRTLTEMERHQLQQALLLTRSVKHKAAAAAAGLHNPQQQYHHQHPYYHASPISPLAAHPLSPADNNMDHSSCSAHPASSTTSCSPSATTTSATGTTPGSTPASLNNGMSQIAFIKQQQQQQQLLLQQQLLQRKAAVFPTANSAAPRGIHLGAVAGGGFGCSYPTTNAASTPTSTQHLLPAPVVRPSQQPPAETAEVRNRLLELEKHLLDDDDAATDAAAVATTSAASPVPNAGSWNETIQGAGLLISSTSSCSTPPPPPQLQQHQPPPPPPPQQQHPPTPTTTTSAASSCCSSSSPPTASSSSGSPAPAKQLLMESAAAIAEGNTETAAATLAAVRGMVANNSNPRGAGDAEQRLNEYMSAALLSRITAPDATSTPSSSSADQLRTAEHLVSTHVLYEASPLFKLGFMASNLAALDATRGAAVIHVLDFDVGHGVQLLQLLLSLADRPAAARPALVKITAVSDPAVGPYTTNAGCPAMVRAAGERLAKAGERAGIAVRFHAVTTRSGGDSPMPSSSSSSSSDLHPLPLSRQAIGCDQDEPLVVRVAFHLSRVPDESVTPSNPRDDLLRRIKSMNPAVVVLAEQELSGNTAPFLPRFADAHAHYTAICESLHHQPHQDGAAAAAAAYPAPEMVARAEECLGRKAANTVGREGACRVERCEVFGKWRARMSMAGFRPIPFPAGAVESLRARAPGRASGGPGTATSAAGGVGGVVAVKEESGGVGFAWNGRTITVTSAWR